MEEKHLSIENLRRLNELYKLNSKIFLVGLKAYRKFPNGEYDETKFCFLNYLERFTFNLESVNILLEQYKYKPTIEHSIGILIRSSLLDFLVIQYLLSYALENDPIFIKKRDALLCDHLHNTFKYLKLIKNEGTSEQEYVEYINHLFTDYRFLFNEDPLDYNDPSKNLIEDKLDSTTYMYNRVKSSKFTCRFAKVYDLYLYYSKYDHFGLLSHHFQKRGEDPNFTNMIWGIHFMILGLEISLVNLSETGEVDNEVNEIRKYRAEFESYIPPETMENS